MKTRLFAMLILLLASCGWFHRDLVARGVYRVETVGVSGCEVSATAEARDGTLRVEGRLRGMRIITPVEGTVDVRLVSSEGKELASRSTEIRLVNHRRTSHSHPEFEAAFEVLPPPGTVIRVFPRISLCPSVSPRKGR